MIVILTIAAAIIGGLFWADRRRYYRHTYGAVIVSDDQDVIGGDVDAYCDDACDNPETFCSQDDYQDDSNDDYQDDDRGSSSGGGRDD